MLFDQDRNFIYHLLHCTIRRLNNANQQIYEMTFLSVRARIVKRLLRLQAYHASLVPGGQKPVPLRITHQQLADMVGAVRETVSKIIKELQEEGLIRVEQRLIYLARPDLLERKLEEEEA